MKYTTGHRINVRTVRKLTEGQGLTLRNGKIVEYKSGWQVATEYGVKVYSPEEAIKWVRVYTKILAGSSAARNVGLWYENGTYYVDCGNRIPTKKAAIKQGCEAYQISIYSWGPQEEPRAISMKEGRKAFLFCLSNDLKMIRQAACMGEFYS